MNNKKGSYLIIELVLPLAVFIFISIIALDFHYRESINGGAVEDDYAEGRRLVEMTKFEDLRTSRFSDGTEIKVSASAEYPGDKIVEYKSVVFPVENHEGNSVAVATYSSTKKKSDNNMLIMPIVMAR